MRKAAARERKGALLSQLETRKAADAAAARGPLLGGSLGLDLDDALAEVAAAPARRDKNRPNAANNRGRRVIAAQETERFGAVLKDARFRADPLGAVLGPSARRCRRLLVPRAVGRRASVSCARLGVVLLRFCLTGRWSFPSQSHQLRTGL